MSLATTAGANDLNYGANQLISSATCKSPTQQPYHIVDEQHNCVFQNCFYSMLDVAWRAGQFREGSWMATCDAPLGSSPPARTRPPAPAVYF